MSLIQKAVESRQLRRYVDKSWVGRDIKPNTWNGEYLDESERKIYRLEGTSYTSTKGKENYKGTWKVVRQEKETDGGKCFESDYLIKFNEPGIFSQVHFEIYQALQSQCQIVFNWDELKQQNNATHSRLIKSTVEYGIISAFEDIKPENAKYTITFKRVGYHPIDTSFKLLNFVTIRNAKRAFFTEHQDLNPLLEKGEFKHRGALVGTIIKFNN